MRNETEQTNHIIDLLCSDDNVNNAAELKGYLKANKISINDENYDFGIIAASEGKIKYLEVLLNEALNMDNYIEIILAEAANRGHKKCVKLLLDKGADIKYIAGTSSYNNFPGMEKFLDQYKKEHKKTKKNFRQEIINAKNKNLLGK